MENINGMTLGTLSVVVNILLALFLFALFFNWRINKLGARAEGWSWLLVLIGNLVTLAGIGLLDLVLDWNAFFVGLLAFAASGLPMAIGAWRRHQEAVERAMKAARE